MDSNPLERERGITILAKNTAISWHGHQDQHRRHAGPRRLRRRGRAHSAHGGWRAARRRRVRRPDAADALRAAQGARARSHADRRHQQDRPAGRRSDARARRSARSVHRARGRRGAARRAGGLRLGARRHVDARPGSAAVRTSRRCSTRSSSTFRRRRSDASGPFQMLISTIDHSPYLGRLGDRPHRAGHGARRRRVALLPLDPTRRPSSRASRSCSRSRGSIASRCTRRPAGEIVALAGLEDVEIGLTVTDVEHPERLDGIAVEEPTISRRLHRQQLAVRRQGREVRHVAPAARAAVQGARAQRRAARRGHRLDRHVDRVRPRRAASHDSDGDDAARGLRVPGVASARDHARGSERRAARAVRGAVDRRARGVPRRRDREARAAPRRDAGDEESGAGTGPTAVPDSGARTVRVPVGVSRPIRAARASCTTGSSSTGRGRDRWPDACVGRWCRWRVARSSRSRLATLQERSTLFVAAGRCGVRRDDRRREFARRATWT